LTDIVYSFIIWIIAFVAFRLKQGIKQSPPSFTPVVSYSPEITAPGLAAPAARGKSSYNIDMIPGYARAKETLNK